MAAMRKPVFTFKDGAAKGLDKVALNGVIFISTQTKFYKYVDLTGVSGNTTINDAITGGNVQEITSSGGGTPTDIKTSFVTSNTILVRHSYQLIATKAAINSSIDITLPNAPMDGDTVVLFDATGEGQDRLAVIKRNGKTIDGEADDLTCDVNYYDIKLAYDATDSNWVLGGK